MSISGIEILSGFKNLSNNRLCSIGSSSVIPREYATILPAAEPLPGPTGMLCSFAQFIKSQVNKKYAGKPILKITDFSYSYLSTIESGTGSPYLSFKPFLQRKSKYSSSVISSGHGYFGKYSFVLPNSNLSI